MDQFYDAWIDYPLFMVLAVLCVGVMGYLAWRELAQRIASVRRPRRRHRRSPGRGESHRPTGPAGKKE